MSRALTILIVSVVCVSVSFFYPPVPEQGDGTDHGTWNAGLVGQVVHPSEPTPQKDVVVKHTQLHAAVELNDEEPRVDDMGSSPPSFHGTEAGENAQAVSFETNDQEDDALVYSTDAKAVSFETNDQEDDALVYSTNNKAVGFETNNQEEDVAPYSTNSKTFVKHSVHAVCETHPDNAVLGSRSTTGDAPFCPDFVRALAQNGTYHPPATECRDKLPTFTDCTVLSRGLFAYGYSCRHQGRTVVLKRNLHPARYKYDQDEATVLCQLTLLRRFNISDNMMGIHDFFSCGQSEVGSFVQGSAAPERMGPVKGGTFLVLELATKPKMRMVSEVQIFELVYLLLASYVTLRITVTDLWVRHLFMHKVDYHRLYTVGNASIIIPSGALALRLIDASSHEHHFYKSVIHLLRSTNYHWLFFKHELTHRADTLGATLANSGKSLIKWTKTEPFMHMSPDQGLEHLVRHMEGRGYGVKSADPLPANTRCYTIPSTVEGRMAVMQHWGDMEGYHWYKSKKYFDPSTAHPS